jgi:signal peptidase I
MAQATFQKSTAREYFESIVVAVILALFIRTFVVQAFKIPTGSMEPNLLVGDHLLVNKFIFAPTVSPLERTLLPMRQIRRGDILVFKFPEEPERDFIKRTIGLPGDTVELKNGLVFVNGVQLDEPYIYQENGVAQTTDPQAGGASEWVVPLDQLLVMGDHRENSADSRTFGPIEVRHVIGRAWLRYWPFDTFGILVNPGHPELDGATPSGPGPSLAPSPSS